MWIKASTLKDGGFKNYCEAVPVQQGQIVRIPKGTKIKTCDPSHPVKVAGRTYQVKVAMVCHGSTLGRDPCVSWAGAHGYWYDAHIDDIEVEKQGE